MYVCVLVCVCIYVYVCMRVGMYNYECMYKENDTELFVLYNDAVKCEVYVATAVWMKYLWLPF
jgi:hypothetical protein